MTDIQRENGALMINPTETPYTGIVFLYASWSESSLFLKYLADLLEEYPTIPLFVYDIDKEESRKFCQVFNVTSHGYGETFWIFKDATIASILNFRHEGSWCRSYNNQLLSLIEKSR